MKRLTQQQCEQLAIEENWQQVEYDEYGALCWSGTMGDDVTDWRPVSEECIAKFKAGESE